MPNQTSQEYSLQVIYFGAPWCTSCEEPKKQLEGFQKEYEGKAIFSIVDIDKNPELVKTYSITHIPAICIIKNGDIKNKLIGINPTYILKRGNRLSFECLINIFQVTPP